MHVRNEAVEERCHGLSFIQEEAHKALGMRLREHHEEVLPGFLHLFARSICHGLKQLDFQQTACTPCFSGFGAQSCRDFLCFSCLPLSNEQTSDHELLELALRA